MTVDHDKKQQWYKIPKKNPLVCGKKKKIKHES